MAGETDKAGKGIGTHQAGDASGGAEGVAASEAGEELGIDSTELLSSLARLDLEAALAYDAGAEAAGDAEVEKQLRAFAADHYRHVDELNRILQVEGGPAIERKMVEPGLLRGLARMASPLGPVALVMTLLNDEQLTNLTYEAALEYDWDEGVRQSLERAMGDEQRHLSWLSAKEDELQGIGPEDDAGAPA